MTTITVGSVTNAIKAKRLLQQQKIPTKIIKVTPIKEKGGCTHGVQFPTEFFYSAINELIKSNVKYTLYSQE